MVDLNRSGRRFTSPPWGEVDLRSKSGEGAPDYRGTVTPHPNPLPRERERTSIAAEVRFNLIMVWLASLHEARRPLVVLGRLYWPGLNSAEATGVTAGTAGSNPNSSTMNL
jgi:hypothetical protein